MLSINKFNRFISFSVLGLLLLWGAGYLIFIWADRHYPLDYSRYMDTSVIVTDKNGKWLRAYLSHDEKWRFPSLTSELPARYLDLLINFEDRRFYEHSGVDYLSIFRALIQNFISGKIISGASTLSMQTSRLLMPHPRTFKDKIIEAFRARQLERHFTKDKILHIYTTLAPMGRNLEGTKAASYYYFNKPLNQLSLSETAWLVALPQAPKGYDPDIYPKRAKRARDKVLKRASDAGIISNEDYANAVSQPLLIAHHTFPFIAPHYADRVRRERIAEVGLIKTSIDLSLQQVVEERLRQYLPLRHNKSNLSAAIIDNKNGNFLTYIGGADFFSKNRKGQVDILHSMRSPGSALKPFITLYAFDWLKYQPDTWVYDTPIVGSSYQPKNYDGEYLGRITLAQALLLSRNVPAVRLLQKIQADIFAAKLRAQGLTLEFLHHDSANLSLALGGVGIKGASLLNLYRQLALCTYSEKEEDTPLASRQACWQVTHILQHSGDGQGSVYFGVEPVAFKTGTSYGWRDQWLFAYTKDYSLVLWGGQADGSYAEQRASAQDLIPLLRQIVALLPNPPSEYSPPVFDLQINTDKLPQRLVSLSQQQEEMQFVTPLSDAEIELPKNVPLTLKIRFGKPPYLWLVNDEIYKRNSQQQISYPVSSSGFYRFTVIDHLGKSVNSQVSIQVLE